MIAFGGEELKEQIRSYMQYRGTAAMVEYLAEQLGVMSGIREGESLLERKVELERATAETEKSRIRALMDLEEMETGWQQVEESMNRIKERVKLSRRMARISWQRWMRSIGSVENFRGRMTV